MEEEVVTMKSIVHRWSKWGRGQKNEFVPLDKYNRTWFCQMCGLEQSNKLPHYLFSFDKGTRDYIVICSNCKFKTIKDRITTFDQLKPPEYKPVQEPKVLIDSVEQIDKRFEEANNSLKEVTVPGKVLKEYQICLDFLEQIADETVNTKVSDLASEILSRLTLIE